MAHRSQVQIPGSLGHKLAARFELPAGTPRGFAIFAHCFACSKDQFATARIARQLVQLGVGVLRFDFTGLGFSEGDFSDTTFSSNIDDLVAASQWMEEQGMAPTLAIGHSLGGAAVLAAASKLPTVKAFVSIAAPSCAKHVTENFGSQISEIETKGEADVQLAGRTFKIKKQFLDDVEDARVIESVRNMKRPLLVMHSPIDQTVGIENANDIFMAAMHPKSFVSLDDSDHLLTDREDAKYVAGVIAAWATHYAIAARKDKASVEPVNGNEPVVVEETQRGSYENWVVTGDYRGVADEPVDVGGDGAGPTPYQYMNAALGACTSMTLRMYAQRKGWPVDKVSVSVTHEKSRNEVDSSDLDVFNREITILGDLNAEQRTKMMEIADKCPVHRTLHRVSSIHTTEST
ncbi:bifunctional alpha/beta hydrolase/OsmC family protein [Hirschia baltica]|uniref:OsmC family protein n=1 Tax=Hirschia baltica (strain ATCC 49814 / DSM 5838 / IFAM 1418) TaxID=582402 RepID=C6XIM3_HIRBI|nr:alpha/beta fold hydrolase [Hirschia baltica]ACT58968.1 OsmC family protein [Hirschia baltica ATCC 49814]